MTRGIQDPRTHRPSALEQQRRGRGLLVVTGALALVLMGGVGALAGLVASPCPDGPGQSSRDGSIVVEPGAPQGEGDQGPDAPADDERRASLELDPDRDTVWNYEGTGEKTVYLTFDDGPSENTPRVLDVLERYGVKATFFVTGHEPDKRGYIKDAYDRGNSIGLHTMSHDYAAVYASEDAFFSDLEQVGEVVREQIGFVPFLTRFPGGASNTISANYCPGIMSALSRDVPARGYQYFDWNVSSGDASGTNVSADTIVSSSCVEGYTNVMLLFHDSNTKDTTPDALPRIIEFYRDRGYRFEPITRDSFVCHHGVSN